ncbi:hypothetical protein Tdes44962_MAKER03479 [Teratosphaeria destructans]|uniref:Uncharacterized protein n=1 Tax=Teratosphaeria destructans TaxID=418781 RepID=A0A9W7SPU4_9PEZI|nr:hypothetical protein Tdes44962_MAKER03479 [Teratosphaeria destructans]
MASIRNFLSSLSPSKAANTKPSPEQETRASIEENDAGPTTSSALLRLCLGFQRWRERPASLLTLPQELRDMIFHHVLGDDVGKVRNVAYGHVELQLDIDCALAYTCMGLRREFNAHVYRRLSSSLRFANQTMIIYPFKPDDWATTLANGLCTSSSLTYAVYFGVHTTSQKADGAATHIILDDYKPPNTVGL